MEIYSPFTRIRGKDSEADTQQENSSPAVVTDEMIIAYAETYLQAYHDTLQEFFPTIGPLIETYAHYPYATFVLRMGDAGYIMVHRPAETASVTIVQVDALDPPLQNFNLYDIMEYFGATWSRFDLAGPSYEEQEAHDWGIRLALNAALNIFWLALNEPTFQKLCVDLLHAEEIELQEETSLMSIPNLRFNAIGKIAFHEPAGFRRLEQWVFEFKHWKNNRVSADDLLQLEAYLNQGDEQIDVVVLMTSGDLTSIGRAVSIRNPQIRIWDRMVLNVLINRHLDTLATLFPSYYKTVEQLTSLGIQEAPHAIVSKSRAAEFSQQLEQCPSGHATFTEYERIGTELLQYVFEGALGPAQVQSRTQDGVERRDVLFRNNRVGRFWQQIGSEFGANVLIVDFKNYGEPLEPGIINDVLGYANDALGHFILVVSRHGARETMEAAQLRTWRTHSTLVLVVNDDQLQEMVHRKEAGEEPADILEDLLSSLRYKY